ncbi:MAG: LysM peptidoglycan-binding domain-containing protein [Flavobacteriia bacterium]|nr:LysM peptidoglycan-binding domain-containing protein [Flavobacteriia bacterium]OJX34912.1 MAG: hypothetical protein BGO87_09225 [Flavobacteriia bacterium 40-80]
MKNILLVLFLFAGLYVAAQNYETINGRKFIVHQVVAGNTLYSIAKQYNVTLSDVLNNNPEAENGIKVGQNIYIPVKEEVTTKTTAASPEDADVKLNRFHTVQKQETLYSIAQKYDLTMNDLIKLNPGIENGVKVGQQIIIPDAANKSSKSNSANIVFYDTIITHVVLQHETLYSLSKRYMVPQKDIVAYNGIKNNSIKPGEKISIPLKKEEIKKVEVREVPEIQPVIVKEKVKTSEFVFRKKDSYKIVLALPLGLSNPKEMFGTIATEFYMGAEYALDSLQKNGLNADVFVIDCSGDTTAFFNRLTAHKDADLMIGPFIGASVDVAAKFCRNNDIKLINPLIGYTKPLQHNPSLVNAMTSDITLMEGLATYVSKKSDTGKIILVKSGAADQTLYNAFRNKLQSLNTMSGTKFIEAELADFTQYLAKGVNATIIYPCKDKNSVIKFMNIVHQNNSKTGSGKIEVYGTKEWTSMEEVKNYYKNTYSLHFSMANDFEYSKPETETLLKGIRKKYNTDLTKITAQGFDVVYYFVSSFLMDKTPGKLVMNDFNLKQVSQNSGFENTSTYIYKQENFDYILLEKIK